MIGVEQCDVRRVLEATSDSEPGVRSLAVQTLPLVCGSNDAVPALIKALGDSDAAVQMEAARALSAYGPSATAALPALQLLSRTANGELRTTATATVKMIQTKRNPDDD
jgi:HEAT repeat protein